PWHFFYTHIPTHTYAAVAGERQRLSTMTISRSKPTFTWNLQRLAKVEGPRRRGHWRRGRDLNPRYGCPYAAFRVRCIRPLCHLSGAMFRPWTMVGAANSMTRAPAQGIWPFCMIAAAFGERRPFTSARRLASPRRESAVGARD